MYRVLAAVSFLLRPASLLRLDIIGVRGLNLFHHLSRRVTLPQQRDHHRQQQQQKRLAILDDLSYRSPASDNPASDMGGSVRRSARLLSLLSAGPEGDAEVGPVGVASVPLQAPPEQNRRRRAPRVKAKVSVNDEEDHDDDDGNGMLIEEEAGVTFTATKRGKKKTKRASSGGPLSQPKPDATEPAENGRSRTPVQNQPSLLCLPRHQEKKIRDENPFIQYVMGIDEAGRGPLAGPVVAAAVIAPLDVQGVIDSKRITKEDDREGLYEQLIAMEGIRWAVSVVDAARIDEINILQATMEGMRSASQAVLGLEPTPLVEKGEHEIRVAPCASVDEKGCYVVCSHKIGKGRLARKDDAPDHHPVGEQIFALIDGNRLPRDMPCPSEAIVKGDGKEFCIAAASIIAKVTRDRLMHGYDKLYPEYNLKQHKGYPTAAHMKAVHEFGASPIHRRTFAPLKHMQFDEDGRIVDMQ